MTIKVCVAGATGWTGSLVTKAILASKDFELVGAIARQSAGRDIGVTLGVPATGINIVTSLDEVAPLAPDVLIDYTKPDSIKSRTLSALNHGIRVVIGTSGLDSADYGDIEKLALARSLGVISAGNFSITAALAKHFSLIAAQHLPTWEIVDYAHAAKVDAPSGTTRELAEAMANVRANRIDYSVDKTIGRKEARGAEIGGAQIHSIRLPGYVIAFETLFGLPNEKLTIRHEAGTGADPYVHGTLLAARRVMGVTGLVRGLDKLLFA